MWASGGAYDHIATYLNSFRPQKASSFKHQRQATKGGPHHCFHLCQPSPSQFDYPMALYKSLHIDWPLPFLYSPTSLRSPSPLVPFPIPYCGLCRWSQGYIVDTLVFSLTPAAGNLSHTVGYHGVWAGCYASYITGSG